MHFLVQGAGAASFLRRIEDAPLTDKICSTKIRKFLNKDPIIPGIACSQLLWFIYVGKKSH